jgi:uridine kinase
MLYHFKDPEWIEKIIVPALLSPGGTTPFIIGIAGPSGVGKTTIAGAIEENLVGRGRKVFRIGMDDFFVSPEERSKLDEWGPDHVRLSELSTVLESIRMGTRTFDVNRSVRRPKRAVVRWTIDLAGIDVILLEGIYVLSSDAALGALGRFVDLGIYLRGTIQDIKRWRFRQEAEKPDARSADAMEKHWREGIAPDIARHVASSEATADWIFTLETDHRFRATRGPGSG